MKITARIVVGAAGLIASVAMAFGAFTTQAQDTDTVADSTWIVMPSAYSTLADESGTPEPVDTDPVVTTQDSTW